jgi:RCC1 and BTB domain-containing protein
LGINSTGNQYIPYELKFFKDKVLKLVCGGYHTFAILGIFLKFKEENGNVYAWGYNKSGQLGIGSTKNQYRPILLDFFENEKIIEIACGFYH